MLAARQRRGLAPPYPPRARVVLARARLDAVAGLAGTVGDELRADRRRPRIGVLLVGRARRPPAGWPRCRLSSGRASSPDGPFAAAVGRV